jgi:putative SOS response-associated peptidase YedK
MCFSVQVDQDIKKLAQRFQAGVSKPAFDNFYKMQESEPKKYKMEEQIYSKYWAPVIVFEEGKRIIKPMRYQLLPSFCEEDKYTRINPKTGRKQEIKNTFNARIDSLEKARAWKIPFGKQHAILPLVSFYEWVPRDNRPTLINFKPTKQDYHLAPCLYDTWEGEDDRIIQSFAIITTEPRQEVLAMGHDRSPIALKENFIDQWLSPQSSSKSELYQLLNQQADEYYQYEWTK